MSDITIDSEKIVEIIDALRKIEKNAERIGKHGAPFHVLRINIIRQVVTIDGLLPDVKFEEAK